METKGTLILLCLVFASLFSRAESFPSEASFKLKVKYNQANLVDTLVLVTTSQYFKGATDIDYSEQKSVVNKDGYYHFTKITNQDNGYWLLKIIDSHSIGGVRSLTIPFFWERGDNITLGLTNVFHKVGLESYCTFTGTSANKYTLRYKIDSLRWNSKSLASIKDEYSNLSVINNKILIKALKLYDSLGLGASKMSQNILWADNFCSQGFGLYAKVSSIVTKKKDSISSSQRELFKALVRDLTTGRNLIVLDSSSLAKSQNAVEFIFYSLKAESLLNFRVEDSLWIFNEIKSRYTKDLRDKLISYLLVYNRNDKRQEEQFYNEAIKSVKNQNALGLLNKFKQNFERSSFGNYALVNEKKETVSFNSFKGKMIIIDFWFTGCAYCSVYYSEVLSKIEAEFVGNERVVFVSVCLDKDRERWKKSITSGLYSSPFAINLYTNGQGWDHDIVRENNINSAPTVLVIDKDGYIKFSNTKNLYTIKGLRKLISDR